MWIFKLNEKLINSQKALDTAKTITLPIPEDKLIITTDTSR